MGQALPEKASSAWGSVVTTLLARLLLLTRADEKGVPHVAPIPAGERPVLDDLGIHHDLNGHIKERNDLKVVKLVVANLAQLLVIRLGVRDLQQVCPHLVD